MECRLSHLKIDYFCKKENLMTFKSGFVNIVGKPNAGKSTLMNALVGERMAIITHKPQTTRHRIIGIISEKDYQIVLSDTPGFVEEPSYKMHEVMNSYVQSSLEDADILLFVMDVTDTYDAEDGIIDILKKTKVPVFVIMNKVDLIAQDDLELLMKEWAQLVDAKEIIPMVASEGMGVGFLKEQIVALLPEGEPFYPPEQLTDRPERFFVSEIIREKILLSYGKEVPYSCDVNVEEFVETHTKSGQPIIRIRATIYVERKSQVSILIGKGGTAIKRMGTFARKDLEKWLQSKVFLDMTVKVKEKWRSDTRTLKWMGY